MSLISHEAVAPTVTQYGSGGEGIGRHRHDQHQLIYVSTGVLALRAERGAWVVSLERAVWVPAGLWHEHRFHGATSLHTLGFAVDDSLFPPGTAPTIVAVSPLARELIIAAACRAVESDLSQP